MTAPLTRAVTFDTRAAAAAGAAIPATFASTTPVNRAGMLEVLDCSPAGVDLTRAPLPLIVAHESKRLAVGVVENIRAHGDRVSGDVRFSSSPEAQQLRADAVDGINSLSVGYVLLDEGRRAGDTHVFRWMPYEVSVVSVPADHQAGFFRSLTGVNTMTTPVATPAAEELSESQEIAAMCKRHGLLDFVPTLTREGGTLADARAFVVEELARRDRALGGHMNVNPWPPSGAGAGSERDLIVNTLVARMGGRPEGDVIRATDCVGLAVRALELSGELIGHGESRDRIVQRALTTRMHTTSDFASLLGDAVGRVLHGFYGEAAPPLRAVARLATLKDFRERKVIRMSSAPDLEKVNEHGEFKYGGMSDSANGWRLATYGRIIALSRQALINDDLGGFASVLQQYAQAAARREADELNSALTTSPTVDSGDVFQAPRSSLITKTLTIAGLGVGVAALRAQKEGGELIMQEPGAIVVPAALEMTARQLVASFTAVEPSQVQPWRLNVIVEPRLDAVSATAWYLVAANQRALEYGYLDGANGLEVFTEEGFNVDGLEIKARLDFGCGWVAPVGWVKSTGAEA